MFQDDKRSWLALLAVATIAVGGYMLGPAFGGGLFTKKRATKLFYKKSESDQRYARAGSSYSTDEADSRFASASGPARITEHGGGWKFGNATGPSTEADEAGGIRIDVGGMTTGLAQRPLSVPQTLFGEAMRITGFEVCYDTDTNSTLNNLELVRERATAAAPRPTSVPLISDGTARTDATCRTYNAPSPIAIDPADELHVITPVNFSAAGSLYLGRVSLLLVP